MWYHETWEMSLIYITCVQYKLKLNRVNHNHIHSYSVMEKMENDLMSYENR